jgi:hypothetical protein
MSDVDYREQGERQYLESMLKIFCAKLATHMGCSSFNIPFGTDKLACFGTRADILDLLREDNQWVEYKGVD